MPVNKLNMLWGYICLGQGAGRGMWTDYYSPPLSNEFKRWLVYSSALPDFWFINGILDKLSQEALLLDSSLIQLHS